MSTGNVENEGKSAPTPTWTWYSMLLSIVFSVIGVGAVAIAGYAIYLTGQAFSDGHDMAATRHLITVVVVIGTLAIALIIVLAVVLQTDSNSMERFEKAKQVLTILVGILGTVIGFYFGAATQPPTSPQPHSAAQTAGNSSQGVDGNHK